MKRRILSSLMALVLVFGLLPATAFAEETPDAEPEVTAVGAPPAEEGTTPLTAPEVKIGDQVYADLDEALQAAKDGDTIQLGKGTYSGNAAKPTDPGKGAGKSLTFVGAGTDKTKWKIQATQQYDSDGWCDYSFRGSDRITFENMTVVGSVYPDKSTKSNNTQGLTYINHITLKDCIFNGRADYWGYETTTFENVIFNAPGTTASGVSDKDKVDYSLWTYTGKSYTFENCTFNSAGKTINVYRHGTDVFPTNVTVNFKDCTVKNTGSSLKPVLNINDSTMGDYKYLINISGNNSVSGVTPDSTTCSRLFGYGGKAETNNTGKTVVTVESTKVWENGQRVGSHAQDIAGGSYNDGAASGNANQYTDGYKDNAFTETWGAWTAGQDGKLYRTGKRVCNYCGYSEDINDAKDFELDVSRSKTATELDANKQSTVTLSLPSAQEELTSDIVFVLDKSQCGNASAEAAKELVSQLLAQQELKKAKLKVGVIAFGGTAKVTRALSEVTSAEDLSDSVTKAAAKGLHGSNIQSGLIEADKMLAVDTAVSDNRKYVILISDGHTYEFSKEGEYDTYVDGAAQFTGLKTYGIYSENDLYAYAYGISYTIHNLHDQYYTGDYNADGTNKDGWTGSYLTASQYKTGKAGDSNEVGNVYEMPYGTWDAYLKHITEVVGTDNGKYDVELHYKDYGNNYVDYDNQVIGNKMSRVERAAEADRILGANKYIKCGLDAAGNDNQLMHASGVDRAVYEAYNKYASMAEKYHCYPIYVNRAGAYDRAMTTQDYGYQLMNALGEISNNTGTDVGTPNAPVAENLDTEKLSNIFSGIGNEILYAVGAGSTVEDKMGSAFNFVPGTLKLTVGGKGLASATVGNVVYFGDRADMLNEQHYRFKVAYDPAADAFLWTINENVSNFAPVQLSYIVKLVDPKTAAGTYTEPTNEYAKLTPRDSAGNQGKELPFPVPKVSYTVNGSGGDDGDDDDKYFFAIQKVDAQDGHALNGAVFELYQRDNRDNKLPASRKTTAHWSTESGIALFSVSATKTSNGGSTWYYREITAPEGYVLDSTEHKIKATDFSDTSGTAVSDAKTVRNYRGTTPDLLNDSDHFAYVIGYMDGNVRPYGLISRAETTTIFFRLLKDSVRDGNLLTSNTYTDVADDYWANTAISTMTGLGIVQGRSTTTFDPKAPITRAQFAAICARFDTGKSSGEQTFSDIQGHWAEKYIERAAELGWIKGFEDGTFRPDTYITRAQAMTMINRVLNRIPEDESDLLPGMNVWPDCNPGDWFYLAVQEATNSHDFEHKAGNYETWTGMNKDPDWTRYEH